jgi:NDP-sugar pyrophosphorylase family protein
MQAVILAGGKGTRMKPYTVCFPKPLVPLGDYPILEIVIRQLKKHGFDNIQISTGHLSSLIEAYCGNGERWGVKIKYLKESTPLSTAGFLNLMKNCEEDFLVINGDILTTLNFKKLFNLHKKSQAMATIAVKNREAKIDFGVVKTDKKSFLSEYQEKPVFDFSVSMGVYVLSGKCRSLVRKGEALGMPDIFRMILKSGRKVYCHKSDCFWLDIGRVDDYEKAQEEFEKNRKHFLGSGER